MDYSKYVHVGPLLVIWCTRGLYRQHGSKETVQPADLGLRDSSATYQLLNLDNVFNLSEP